MNVANTKFYIHTVSFTQMLFRKCPNHYIGENGVDFFALG